MIAAVAATALVPVAVSASHTFTDVPDTNLFHDDITWLADAGVTKGCNPPANDQFCPSATVTREQMAAFMKRLAEAQVVDAATALQADNATNATNAADADTVDGMDAADLMPMWALIKGSDGSIISQSGGITAVRGFAGGYYVDFGADVKGHALMATLQWPSAENISAAICGGPTDETVTCVVGDDDSESVYVRTTDSAALGVNADFYITVLP